MKKKYGYHVTCPNDDTHEFPYVIEFEPDKAESEPRIFEVACPYCKQVMTLPVKEGMKMVEATAVRGIEKL